MKKLQTEKLKNREKKLKLKKYVKTEKLKNQHQPTTAKLKK